MKCQILFLSGKINQNIIDLSSDELAQREVKSKERLSNNWAQLFKASLA